VAVRNHAVLLAAQDETYLFSHRALIEWLTQKFGLSSREADLLGSLRTLKREYRGTGKVSSAGWQQLVATQAVVERVFFVTCASPPKSLIDFAHQRVASIPPVEAWYLALRSYEGAIRSIHPLLTADCAAELHCLEEVIRRPSPYSAADFGGLPGIQSRLSAILANLPESNCKVFIKPLLPATAKSAA